MSGHRILQDLAQGQNSVLDPGNGKEIKADRSFQIVNLVSAGAETRTITDPTKDGIVLALVCVTYVGDIVVTCPAGINQSGNSTITFNGANDLAILFSVPKSPGGTAYRWRLWLNDGCTLG